MSNGCQNSQTLWKYKRQSSWWKLKTRVMLNYSKHLCHKPTWSWLSTLNVRRSLSNQSKDLIWFHQVSYCSWSLTLTTKPAKSSWGDAVHKHLSASVSVSPNRLVSRPTAVKCHSRSRAYTFLKMSLWAKSSRSKSMWISTTTRPNSFPFMCVVQKW